jgi:hypothetical protein
VIRFHVSLATAALAVGLLLLAAAPASAQSARTWVSGVGDDANPCSRTAPCQTFATAIQRTNPGGEIDCLDSGGFGRVIISHAVSIICDGVGSGGITMGAQGDSIDVEAGPSDVVVLSGLDLEGAGVGIDGVDFMTGQALYVRNCVIRDFTQSGITFGETSNAPVPLVLHVDNTTIENTASNAFNMLPTPSGIMVSPGPNAVHMTINRSQIVGNTYGIVVEGSSAAGMVSGVVRDSLVSDNSDNGISLADTTGSGAKVILMVDNVAVIDNGANGLAASGANMGMRVRNSAISGNGGGVNETNSGNIVSYGNNSLNGNSGNDGAFSGALAQK